MRAVSLFAGIGGFDLAMERAGIRVAVTVEIDSAARKILARHFPDALYDYDDVRKISRDTIGSQHVDIVTAGWPCQGNSVAGLRAGMADPRSGLWAECVRVLSELRPRWFIGENVPGLLTVNDGRDFRRVVTDLAQLGYGVAWRVLDAQGFGVPQRRRRVIVVGCLGDPRGAVEVLLEPESFGGSAPESGEARREAAGTPAVGTLQGGGQRGYRIGAEDARDGHLIACTVRGDVTQPLTAGASRQTSEDGTGRALPIVAYAVPDVMRRDTAHEAKMTGDDGTTTNLIVAFSRTQVYPRASESAFPTLRANGSGHAVAYAEYGHARWREDDQAGPLQERDYKDGGPRVLVQPLRETGIRVASDTDPSRFGKDLGEPGDPSYTLRQGGTQHGVLISCGDALAVRRLMPLECERLQGFPDGWTDGQSDAARYRQLGNAVAVPVIEWVMRRIAASEQQAREDAIAA